MKSLNSALLPLLLLGAASVVDLPGATISVRNEAIQPNATNQRIVLQVSGGEAVAGMNLVVTVAANGPRITGVNLQEGTIWGASSLPANAGSQDRLVLWTVTTASGTVPAEGVLAVLIADTTGVEPGEYQISFSATVGSLTQQTELLNDRAEVISTTYAPSVIRVTASTPPPDSNTTLLPRVTIHTEDALAAEGQSIDAASFTIRRSGSTTQPLQVAVTISGTATEAQDFVLEPAPTREQGRLLWTIPSGREQLTIILTPINDRESEGTEEVAFKLQANASYEIGDPSEITIQILDAPITQEATSSELQYSSAGISWQQTNGSSGGCGSASPFALFIITTLALLLPCVNQRRGH